MVFVPLTKNVNTPRPVRVRDKQYENRTLLAFEAEHKGKFIVMHDEDKNGRGKHLHTATSKEQRNDLTQLGKYNQHKGHIPENMEGFDSSSKGC
ncbi:HNH/endonuclease VII fold putative polymorphic toxin [Vibrio rotiferianus]|uniref:HNH/endonuclease VII fold putative polymorphic toxin n=1 Tax=Vibrio rotiferianus TaxID=190895 RepID=UPI0005EDE55A